MTRPFRRLTGGGGRKGAVQEFSGEADQFGEDDNRMGAVPDGMVAIHTTLTVPDHQNTFFYEKGNYVDGREAESGIFLKVLLLISRVMSSRVFQQVPSCALPPSLGVLTTPEGAVGLSIKHNVAKRQIAQVLLHRHR